MSTNNDWFSEFENFAVNKPKQVDPEPVKKEEKIEPLEKTTPKKTEKKNYYFYYFLIPIFLLILFYFLYQDKVSRIREDISTKFHYFERKMDTLRMKLHGAEFNIPSVDTTKN